MEGFAEGRVFRISFSWKNVFLMLATLQPAFVRFGGESPRHQLVILVDEHVLELDLDSGVGQ